MQRGRRRKIEVPTGDTQPQFELGDTTEDIERRRREREERERREQEEKDRGRMEREREESPERGEKRVQTDTDTDVESTQSRQKKSQMKSRRGSDEDAIVEFVKQHKELYDKTNNSFKDKQKKEGLCVQLAATRNLPVKTMQKWFDTPVPSDDSHHVCRSSLRSVPADEVDDFHISGCTSGPHSKC